MCEKRTRKIKKGSNLMRLREARRMQRIQMMSSPPTPQIPRQCQQQVVDKNVQNRVLLELAWKTVALMHKNKIIQQKIVDLQKETSEFVASVMNNPENRQRYIEQIKAHDLVSPSQLQEPPTIQNNNLPLKVEPTA